MLALVLAFPLGIVGFLRTVFQRGDKHDGGTPGTKPVAVTVTDPAALREAV